MGEGESNEGWLGKGGNVKGQVGEGRTGGGSGPMDNGATYIYKNGNAMNKVIKTCRYGPCLCCGLDCRKISAAVAPYPKILY